MEPPLQRKKDLPLNILAFESSCDETAAAVVRDGRTVLSDAIASQADMHALYGGVVPEIASRKHVEAIAGLADAALAEAGLRKADVDAVAVTYGPGLIGALLVGVNFAKSVAYGLGVPLIPVHHVRGHISANYIAHPELEPPFVCLCVSLWMCGTTPRWRSWAPPGMTRRGSVLTRWPGCWASATPEGPPWTASPGRETPEGTPSPGCRSTTLRWTCPFPA